LGVGYGAARGAGTQAPAGLALFGRAAPGGGLLLEEGRYEQAAEIYRKAISEDEYLEGAHWGLMRSYARMGDRGRALEHYRSLVGVLSEALGTEPAAGDEGALRGAAPRRARGRVGVKCPAVSSLVTCAGAPGVARKMPLFSHLTGKTSTLVTTGVTGA
jgi:DNA-binding SARP family transcriptional activator